jgi:uncharacterized membrane protein YhaH (DUF805 family)
VPPWSASGPDSGLDPRCRISTEWGFRYLIVSLPGDLVCHDRARLNRLLFVTMGVVMQWYLKVLQQYVAFSGRARRTEFWMFALFTTIIQIVLQLLDGALGLAYFPGTLGLLTTIYILAVFLPSLGVAVRRLQDTGRSGLWVLIGLVPLVGVIVLIVFWAAEGNRGPNAYGPDPKTATGDPAAA